MSSIDWKYRAESAESILAAANERLDAVRVLAEKWRYKGEHGWGSWQEGQGPDLEGQVLDSAAHALLAIVDPDSVRVPRP